LLYEFHLLFVVSLGIHIELSSVSLENVGLWSFGAHSNDFINSPLNVCTLNFFYPQHEPEKPWIRLLWRENKILVANNVNWIWALEKSKIENDLLYTVQWSIITS
jgi:hypothetical protein